MAKLRQTAFWAALFKTDDTLKYSLTKFWTNVAYAITTAIVAWQAYHHELQAETIGLYLGIVAGHGLGNKYLAQRDEVEIKDDKEVEQ